MSGIFKGDSIYKSGVGGGGYKDGGALVDGDFIEVKNNTISSYDNVSRDPVNFYFEVKDGEILNSVVELTTAVNSTVYVYVLKNGIYYLLGNIGGNTVNAGSNYNINIIGDSYAVEEVSGDSTVPVLAEIDNDIYKIVKFNDLIWMSEDLKGDYYTYKVNNGRYYYKDYPYNFKLGNWRLPTNTELEAIKNYYGADGLASTTGWPVGEEGTNTSGLDIKPNGYYNGSHLYRDGIDAYFAYNINNSISGAKLQNKVLTMGVSVSSWYVNIRLVCKL